MIHSVIGSLIQWVAESSVHWIIGSLNHWFVDYIGSLTHWFTHSLSRFIGALVPSVSCAWILSYHFIRISTTMCSFVDAPHKCNNWLLLHRQNFAIGHWFLLAVSFFRNFRHVGRALLVFCHDVTWNEHWRKPRGSSTIRTWSPTMGNTTPAMGKTAVMTTTTPGTVVTKGKQAQYVAIPVGVGVLQRNRS